MKKRALPVSQCVVIAVFLAILLIGCVVYDDYGLSCDEIIERQSSVVNYRYMNRVLLGRDVFSDIWPTGLSEYRDRYYGVTMQVPLVFAEDMYAVATGVPMPSETVYLMRHLYTFLLYYFALICFYRLLKRLLKSPWYALTGVLMLYLFGQFFAHSFYNIKDLLFASLFMISLACADRVFRTERRLVWCLLFAASGTLLVTSRIVGALLILLVLFIMAAQDVSAARQRRKAPGDGAGALQSRWKRALPYLLICCAYPMWILVTPAAWSNPLGFSLGYIQTFSNYQDPTAAAKAAEALANGVAVQAANTRFYFIEHIALSVPVANQLFCLLGIGVFCAHRIGKRDRKPAAGASGIVFFIMLLLLAGTLMYQAIFQPGVYDGWRHAFYLYPIIVAFAAYGLEWVVQSAWKRKRRWVGLAALALVSVSLLGNAYRIVKAHPYEYAMCNVLARDTEVARERDYWRSSYYELAKWALADAEGTVRVSVIDPTGGKDWIIDRLILARLGDTDAARFAFGYPEESDYVFQNYAYVVGNDWPIEGFTEVYAVWLDGQKLAAVSRRLAPPG